MLEFEDRLSSTSHHQEIHADCPPVSRSIQNIWHMKPERTGIFTVHSSWIQATRGKHSTDIMDSLVHRLSVFQKDTPPGHW